MSEIQLNSETDVLRGLYNFYSNIFNELPDKDRYLTQKDLLSTIEDDGTALAKGLSLMGACLSKTVDDTHVEALMVDWTRLFRGVAPDYGPLPPFESMWRKEDGILETLAGIYAAHGVSVDGGITTMPDYIGVELAFISFLLENGKERDAADFA